MSFGKSVLNKLLKMSSDKLQVPVPNEKIKPKRRWLYISLIFGTLGLLSLGGYLIYYPSDFYMIDRAVEPLRKVFLGQQVQNVIIDENPFKCGAKETCISDLRERQLNRTKLLNDIDSNFFIYGDGHIYEGTGWHINPFSDVNHIIITICVFDQFDRVESLSQKVNAIRRLMAEGVRLGNLSPDYHIFSIYTILNFELFKAQIPKCKSHGSKLYDLMQKWPRFSSDLGLLFPNAKQI